jgi:hypothetical protein
MTFTGKLFTVIMSLVATGVAAALALWIPL